MVVVVVGSSLNNVWDFQHIPGLFFGIIERGVPQAYVRAHASSATLCSVHVLRVFLCIFYIKRGNLIRMKMGLDTYLIRIQTRTPLSRYPPYDYSNGVLRGQNLRLLDKAGNPGRQQHARPENQDSQHKLNQPRESFLDLGCCWKSWADLREGFGFALTFVGRIANIVQETSQLRWAKSCDSYRRSASESYRCDSNR